MDKAPTVKSFFEEVTGTWSYVVYEEGSSDKSCAVIDSVLDYDPASGRTSTRSADKIIEFVRNKGLEVQWVLETHVHADHLTAAQYIKENMGGETAISHHVLKVLETWDSIFNSREDTPLDGSQFDVLFSDDEVFNIGELEAKIIYTPGHTPADTSYLIGDTVFVGDAMFLPDVGTGRCDFPGGNARDSYASCRKLLSLPAETRMFVGHDYPPNESREPQAMVTVEEQRRNNMRIHEGVSEDDYVCQRNSDDKGFAAPRLLLPSIQMNLRAGRFPKPVNGISYLKIPLDLI